ncbi:MAG: hypothetical protein KKD44_28435 [Proteobacteria bacterium]|nr:hypothetical protein [Pseudomonadota bacterium]
MPTEAELKNLKKIYDKYFTASENENKEVEPVAEDSQFCPTCGAPHDHRHIQTDLEVEKDRHQRDVQERDIIIKTLGDESAQQIKELQGQLQSAANGHVEPTTELFEGWRSCPDCGPKLAQLIRDDLNADEVASWLRERQAMGVVKDKDGQNKVFRGIKTGGV